MIFLPSQEYKMMWLLSKNSTADLKLRTQLPCNYLMGGYMPKRNETVLKRHLYTHIYSSIIHRW